MSLTVSPQLAQQAAAGDVDDQTFVACVSESLPYAWNLISELAGTC